MAVDSTTKPTQQLRNTSKKTTDLLSSRTDNTLDEGVDIAVGTSTGSKIGTAGTQKLGFWGVTPVVRPGATDDIKDALVATGILQGTSATPLNLDGGKLTCDEADIDGALNHDGTTVGFFGVTPATRPAETDDIKDALTTLGILIGTLASPLNLDGGKLTCGEAEIDGALNHDGTTAGFLGAAPTTQASTVAPVDASTIDGTWGAEEQAVLADLRTKLDIVVNVLKNFGFIAAA